MASDKRWWGFIPAAVGVWVPTMMQVGPDDAVLNLCKWPRKAFPDMAENCLPGVSASQIYIVAAILIALGVIWLTQPYLKGGTRREKMSVGLTLLFLSLGVGIWGLSIIASGENLNKYAGGEPTTKPNQHTALNLPQTAQADIQPQKTETNTPVTPPLPPEPAAPPIQQRPPSAIHIGPGAGIDGLRFEGNIVTGASQFIDNEGTFTNSDLINNQVGPIPPIEVRPDAKLARLSKADLLAKTNEMCAGLREFERVYDAERSRILQMPDSRLSPEDRRAAASRSRVEFDVLTRQMREQFKASYFPPANALLHALLSASKKSQFPADVPKSLSTGIYAGYYPARASADYLENLARSLP
jgi:hypothetical protein